MLPDLSQAKNEMERNAIIQDMDYPNYRLSLLTAISFTSRDEQEKLLDMKKKEAFARLYDNNIKVIKVKQYWTSDNQITTK